MPLGDPPSKPFSPVGAYPVDRTTGDVTPEGVRFMVTGVAEFLHDWYYTYPFDNSEPIPSPRGEASPTSVSQSARGNILALLPLYGPLIPGPRAVAFVALATIDERTNTMLMASVKSTSMSNFSAATARQ